MKVQKKSLNILLAAVFLVMFGLIFTANRVVPFIRDDTWYMLNLVTEEPLKSLSDILQSQIWHYMNWGGRSITHGLLQAVLMTGEFWADILNTAVAFLLAWMIAVAAGCKKWPWCFVSITLLIFTNYNTQGTMMWQSGCVNYLYSTVWILFFLHLYLRTLEEAKPKPFGICFWIVPLGLITGWSNENMGPTAFVISLLVTAYVVRKEHRKPEAWMVEGCLASLTGSVLVICAPGNFVRAAEIPPYDSVWERLHHTLFEFYSATFGYLFFSLFLLLAATYLYVGICHFKLRKWHWFMYLSAALAHGALLLSPTYPSRASFGIVCLCVTLTISLVSEVLKVCRHKAPLYIAFAFCCFRAFGTLTRIILEFT